MSSEIKTVYSIEYRVKKKMKGTNAGWRISTLFINAQHAKSRGTHFTFRHA